MEFYLSPDGRVSVGQFWLNYVLPILLASMAIGFVYGTTGAPIVGSSMILILGPVLIWSNIVIVIKRLHDIGWTGWAILLTLVPIVGFIVPIIVWFVPGKLGANRYGRDPRPWMPQL